MEKNIKETSDKIDTLKPKYQNALKEEESAKTKLRNINN